MKSISGFFLSLVGVCLISTLPAFAASNCSRESSASNSAARKVVSAENRLEQDNYRLEKLIEWNDRKVASVENNIIRLEDELDKYIAEKVSLNVGECLFRGCNPYTIARRLAHINRIIAKTEDRIERLEQTRAKTIAANEVKEARMRVRIAQSAAAVDTAKANADAAESAYQACLAATV